MYNDNPNEVIVKAVDKLVNCVKPTYGSSKYKVLIEGVGAMDDGVSVARNFHSEDPYENEVLRVIREVSERTSKRVKDGTTGALILLQELVKHPLNNLRKGLEEAKEQLLHEASPITTIDELAAVAKSSCKDDSIALSIGTLVSVVGKDSDISVQESDDLKVSTEVVEGYRVDGELASHYLLDFGKSEAVLKNAAVYLTTERITSQADMQKILEEALKFNSSRNIFIVADDIAGEALKMLILNKMQGALNVSAIKLSDRGDEKNETLDDIASVAKTRVNQSLKEYSFGNLDKVVSERSFTFIYGSKDDERIANLKERLSKATGFERMALESRIAKLSNGLGIVKVGGLTLNEVRELKPKIENAVSSTQLAFKSGVVAGAGVALSAINTSCEALNKALKKPREVLVENLGDFKDTPVDSVEVLIAGLESAVSIAEILLLTKSIILQPKKDVQAA